jgi:hypothetical protein
MRPPPSAGARDQIRTELRAELHLADAIRQVAGRVVQRHEKTLGDLVDIKALR